MSSARDEAFMRLAIARARRAGIVERTGGPFGAVIVRNGEVLADEGNSVLRDRDPTAHAEMNAIRAACRLVGSHELAGATLYASSECCPMCYAAARWARIAKIFHAAAWDDYGDLFDDRDIHADIVKPHPQRRLAPERILADESRAVWEEFRRLPDGARY
jgi:tRNA(Arg) A34 adenosine deaminase TadA